MAENVNKEAKAAAKAADIDPKRLGITVKRIEAHHEELASEQGKYMNACRSIRQSIAGIYEEAKNFGYGKKELKTIIKVRDLDRKKEAARQNLEGDEGKNYDNLMKALGGLKDLPLGMAAMKAEAQKPASAAKAADKASTKAADSKPFPTDGKLSGDADEKDLRPPFLVAKDGVRSEDEKAVDDKKASDDNAAALTGGIKPLGAGKPTAPATH